MRRVTIVDPRPTTREYWRSVLQKDESFWIEECEGYHYFLKDVERSRPDVVIMPLDAAHTQALGLIVELTARYPDLPILAVCQKDDGETDSHR